MTGKIWQKGLVKKVRRIRQNGHQGMSTRCLDYGAGCQFANKQKTYYVVVPWTCKLSQRHGLAVCDLRLANHYRK